MFFKINDLSPILIISCFKIWHFPKMPPRTEKIELRLRPFNTKKNKTMAFNIYMRTTYDFFSKSKDLFFGIEAVVLHAFLNLKDVLLFVFGEKDKICMWKNKKLTLYLKRQSTKLTFPTTRVVLTTSPNNIFETRDNTTFSNLLSIFILFAVVKCWGVGGESEIERVWHFASLTALWVECAYISAVFELLVIKLFLFIDRHALCLKRAFFYQIINFLQRNCKYKQCSIIFQT